MLYPDPQGPAAAGADPRPAVERPVHPQPPASPEEAPDEEAALALALARLMSQGEHRIVMRREDLELIRRKLLTDNSDES